MATVYRIECGTGKGWVHSAVYKRLRALAPFSYRVTIYPSYISHPADDETLIANLKTRYQCTRIPDEIWQNHWFVYNDLATLQHYWHRDYLAWMVAHRALRVYQWEVPEHRIIRGETQSLVIKRTKRCMTELLVYTK